MRPSDDPTADPFVRSALRLEAVDSTNDHARRLLDAGPVEAPALIVADRQTRGRGQGSNAWWSDAGSLTATLILDPSALGLPIDRVPSVALATAVAAIDAIERLYPRCRPGIRWPNDIEVDGRKLGGILPERVETEAGPRLLIGIGLNVRTRLDDAPPEVRRMAATLADWSGARPDADPRADLLRAIMAALPDRLRDLAHARPSLHRRWARLDALDGTRVRIESGTEIIEALAAGIDEQGGLRLLVAGELQIIHAGRVLRD